MTLKQNLQHKIDIKTKPMGALGMLEDIALKIGMIQGTENPELKNPTVLVFAGDHGVVQHQAVSPFPQEVTSQMVLNFLNGGAAINVFCKQHNINLKVIDAGVNFDFEQAPNLIDAKIAKGTQDYSKGTAMTIAQCHQAIAKGKELVTARFEKDANVIGFGEMGIGNTSSAALIMSAVLQVDIESCTGKGTGLNDEGLLKKQQILKQVQQLHQPTNPEEILTAFGGFEIAMMVGAFLQAKTLEMTIIVDGFIVTSALLIAHKMDASVLNNCIFSHCSDEQGHQKMLNYLNVQPILQLGLRLGEGTGVALAYPMIQSAVNFLNQMASFESAGVSNKD